MENGANARQNPIWVVGVTVIVLLLLVVLALSIQCPTAIQRLAFLLILSFVAAAGTAYGIPGSILLHVNLPMSFHAMQGTIKAGGGMAVFVMVFFVGLELSNKKVDGAFNNASCQGQIPAGSDVASKKALAVLDIDTFEPIFAKNARGRPVKFSFQYQFEPHPGIRDWSQIRPGVWVEMYPDPSIVTIFGERSRETLDGCGGSIVSPKDTDFSVFIPDKGCARMWVRFRHGSGEWQQLGVMDKVE